MRKMNIIVMTLAGLLLIAASILKFQEMLSICVPGWDANAAYLIQSAQKAGQVMPVWKANVLGFWESYEFLLFQIPVEFALGVWLLSGLFRKGAWIVGTLAYFGFIFVTLSKWVTGAASCGCFGQVHVDPRITLFAIDVPFFLLLAIFRPKGYKLLPPPWPNTFYLLAVFVFTIGLMVLAPSAMVAFRPDCIKAEDVQTDPSAQLKLQIHQLKQQLQKQTDLVGPLQQNVLEQQQAIAEQQTQIQSLQQQIEQLKQAAQVKSTEPDITEVQAQESEQTTPVENQNTEPQSEQQAEVQQQTPDVQQWDWLQYVVEDDVREQLTEELVVVLMYHYDCEDCAVMVPKYDTYCREMIEQGNDAFKVAFLAIPPYGETGPVPEDTPCIHGKLTDEQDWLITSPYVVVLLYGEPMKTWPQGTAPEPEKILDEVFGQ